MAFLVPTFAKSIAAAQGSASASDSASLSERKTQRCLTKWREYLPERKANASLQSRTSCDQGIQPATGDPMTSDTGIAAMKLLVAFARSCWMNSGSDKRSLQERNRLRLRL